MTGKFQYRKEISNFSEQECLDALRNAGLSLWKREMLDEQMKNAKSLREINEAGTREEKDLKMLELASNANVLAEDANDIANRAKSFNMWSTIIAGVAVLVALIANWDKITKIFE